jgi:integrase
MQAFSMAKTDSITTDEFMVIHQKLYRISKTWGDLWLTLFFLRAESCRVVSIKYSDIKDDLLHLAATPKFESRTVRLCKILRQLFNKRKLANPLDIYVFQSKSNRVKGVAKPVTTVAMNIALKEAAREIANKNVTMKSAQQIMD